jgi:hypothetical protein
MMLEKMPRFEVFEVVATLDFAHRHLISGCPCLSPWITLALYHAPKRSVAALPDPLLLICRDCAYFLEMIAASAPSPFCMEFDSAGQPSPHPCFVSLTLARLSIVKAAPNRYLVARVTVCDA